jgi:hypothetical protein
MFKKMLKNQRGLTLIELLAESSVYKITEHEAVSILDTKIKNDATEAELIVSTK